MKKAKILAILAALTLVCGTTACGSESTPEESSVNNGRIADGKYTIQELTDTATKLAENGADYLDSVELSQKDGRIHVVCISEEKQKEFEEKLPELGADRDMLVFDPIE